jgi:hypothetical protein
MEDLNNPTYDIRNRVDISDEWDTYGKRLFLMLKGLFIPFAIILSFVLITYPSTAPFFDYFLPSLESWKGYFIRGHIIATLYFILRYYKKIRYELSTIFSEKKLKNKSS